MLKQYSNALFAKAWMAAAGLTRGEVEAANMARVQFEQRPLKLLLINGGYHTAQYTLYGLVLGLWH